MDVFLLKEFHVAYVFIRMANSPRPGVWVLERSTDFGKTWNAWQFFADTPSDCHKFFEAEADEELYYDDQVLCTTEFSKVVPLEGGEVRVPTFLFLTWLNDPQHEPTVTLLCVLSFSADVHPWASIRLRICLCSHFPAHGNAPFRNLHSLSRLWP